MFNDFSTGTSLNLLYDSLDLSYPLGKQGSGEGDEEKEMASDNDEHDEQAGEGVKGEDGEESDAGDAPARQDREGSDDIIRKCHRLSGVKKHPANQPVVNIPYVPQHR